MTSRIPILLAPFSVAIYTLLIGAHAIARTPIVTADIVEARSLTGTDGNRANDSLARARALEGAERLRKAMVDEDVEVFLDLTLPSVIEMVGGPVKFAEMYRRGMEATHEAKLTMTSYMFNDSIRLARRGSEAYAVIPTVLTMTSESGGRVTIESYLIGFSPDGGGTWKYVNGHERFSDRNELKKLLPGVPKSLKLPTLKEPVVEGE